MIPGSPHPLLMSGGDPLDELGKIDRAVRFRDTASAAFLRTFGAPTSLTIYTACMWVKRGKFAADQILFGTNATTNGWNLMLNSGEQLRLDFNSAAVLLSSQLERDPSSHFMVTYSSNGSTQTIYVADMQFVQSTSATNTTLNSAIQHGIGRFPSGTVPFGGLLSNFAFVDGQALTPAAFGVRHPATGQWRPKSHAAIRAAVAAGGGPRNGWGANGCFLPFDDPTSTTTLGYDRSQSDTDTTGNNWTATNISLAAGSTYDSTLDTPTTNCATLNPLKMPPVDVTTPTLNDGNLTALTSDGILGHFEGSMVIPSTGVWQWEITCLSGNVRDAHGVVPVSALPSSRGWDQTNAVAYCGDGTKYVSGSNSAYGAGYTTNDVIGFVVDRAAGTLTCYKNGASQGAIALPSNSVDLVPLISDFGASGGGGGSGRTQVACNFGQRQFSYPVSGAKCLSAKNLPKPQIPKSSTAFAAVTDTGANILATIAAAESWSSYIRIIKRRDAAEGWRWMFSDDPGYYMDSSAVAAKAAIPAFGGTSYVGYSIKVSAFNGVASGRLNHTNGVSDTVTDNLGNTRKMVILKNEANGSWYVFHPDLTAGQLMYLEQQAAPTTDGTISAVTSTGFTVAAALATGTYRWIAFAELDGFLKLGKYTGNSATDGAFVPAGITPKLELFKDLSGASNWFCFDTARDTTNVAGTALFPSATNGDSAGYSHDIVSNGSKWRWGTGDPNSSAHSYIYLMIAAFPFRYANAR